jgi:hypothetical protein
LIVSVDQPIASVDVTLRLNAVLRGASGSRTTVSFYGAPGSASNPLSPPVVGTIVDLDASASPSLSPSPAFATRTPNVSISLDDCPTTGDCIRHFRVVAALVDQTQGDATFSWNASAQTLINGGTSSAPPPPAGSELEMTTAPIVTSPATTLAAKTLATEHVAVSEETPLLVRIIRLRLPKGPGDGPIVAGAVLRALVDGRPAERDQLIQFDVFDPDAATLTADNRPAPFDPARVFEGCEPGAECERRLRVEVFWRGGQSGQVTSGEWSLSAWASAAGNGKAPPVDLTLESEHAVTAAALRQTTTASGSFDVTSTGQQRMVAQVVLDNSSLPQTTTTIAAARIRLHATATNAGIGKDAIAVFAGSRPAYSQIGPGETLDLVSELVPIRCGGRTTCMVPFDFGAGQSGNGSPYGHVDWTVTAEVIYEDPAMPPADAHISLSLIPLK